MTAQFSITGLNDSDSALFDIWQPVGRNADAPVSFSATDSSSNNDDELVLSVSLPADTNQARQVIRQKSITLQSKQRAATKASQTLQNLSPQSEVVSFSIDQAETNPAKATLQRNLARLQGGHEADVSFALGVPDEWSETVEDYQKFMEGALQVLRPTIRTETKIGDNLIATSSIDMSGNVGTTWHQHTAEYSQLHNETVVLSIKSRVAILQLLGQIFAGAAILAVKFNIPGGQVMALPAAWRYIQDVMKQTKTVGQTVRN
jgi:hypothetical protein